MTDPPYAEYKRVFLDIEVEVRHLLMEAEKEGIFLRLIGGLAVKLHCTHANHRALQRNYPDIDFVTDKEGSRRLMKFLPGKGYAPNLRFNTLNGDRRQIFENEKQGHKMDIFIGDFEMCHRLPLAGRLQVDPITIPLAELFLSKAQIVELNEKDILDMLALLLDHPVGRDDHETINADVVADLCAKDWGLYTTVTDNIQKIRRYLIEHETDIEHSQRGLVVERLNDIEAALVAAPKSLNWKMRARVGRRVRWYLEVEEVQR